MLLSMLMSFLLARKLKVKVYVLLMAVLLIIISLVSIGFPTVSGTVKIRMRPPQKRITVWQTNLPAIPLSFPFYASISVEYHLLFIVDYVPLPLYHIELHFLTSQIWTNYYNNWYLTLEHIILLFSSFLLINLIGALIGYWISKTTFIEKLLKKDKSNYVG